MSHTLTDTAEHIEQSEGAWGCQTCYQPINRASALRRLRAWIAYRIVMSVNLDLVPISVVGWAGEHAYQCRCAATLKARAS